MAGVRMPHFFRSNLSSSRLQRSSFLLLCRCFRSTAAIEALATASHNKVPNIVLYNYPSFSGAFSALFAHLFHSRTGQPCLILPFSSVAPFRVDDVNIDGIRICYFLDFLGPKGFAKELALRSSCLVVGFDHRKASIPMLLQSDDPENKNITFNVDLEKSSSTAAYEYFCKRFTEFVSPEKGEVGSMIDSKDVDRMETVLQYLSDIDLKQRSLCDVQAFEIGLEQWREWLNCITNSYLFEQLKDVNAMDLISTGNTHISSSTIAANKFLDNSDVFKLNLGKGFYGDCLGVIADAESHLSDMIGKQLSLRSAAMGLRPIGAVVYVRKKDLKMSLRSTDNGVTDTSEIAKAYGGGGFPSSSSFIISWDEFNMWHSLRLFRK